jgi:hypothetical protein
MRLTLLHLRLQQLLTKNQLRKKALSALSVCHVYLGIAYCAGDDVAVPALGKVISGTQKPNFLWKS